MVVLGLTVMLEVLAPPGVHASVPEHPLAVKVVLAPAQILLLPDMVGATGTGFTSTVIALLGALWQEAVLHVAT